MMAGEWAQKLITERVIKHIQDGIKKAHKAFLIQQAIRSMNKSHRRRRQIAKAYKLLCPTATVEFRLPYKIHQTITTIKLKRN